MGFYGIEHPNPTTPQFSNPRRGGNKLSGTCIVHTAEMYGALNTAAFCMRRSDYGCYHTIVDDKTIVEVYPYEYETWQDSETNNWAVGISAACDAADWNSMEEAQREGYYRNLAWAGADFVRYMREAYDIEVPRRRLTGNEARNRVPGFCAHGDSGIARTDPGKDFDWDRFFRYIEEELNGEIEVATPEQIAAAVLAQKFTNRYGAQVSLADQIGWIDMNVNDTKSAVLAAISGVQVNVELSSDQVNTLADTLKNSLAPGVVEELAKKLSK